MHPKYQALMAMFETELSAFSATVQPLPGVAQSAARSTFAKQLVESERKIQRIQRFAKRFPSPERLRPAFEAFDPELAAVERNLTGDLDEAFWLVFLSVHFGRHKDDGWLLSRQIYGALGPDPYWTWSRISSDLPTFGPWLGGILHARNEPLGRFGNHRKYESLASPTHGLTVVVKSYVEWVLASGGHAQLVARALAENGKDAREAFGWLYRNMNSVMRFGRLAKFDFLTMLSKLGIASIEADSMYLGEATGPKKGAKLLFLGSSSAAASNEYLENCGRRLAAKLNIGMQSMEDALCNWQKSPDHFVAFRG
jgi:hypothetical protein